MRFVAYLILSLVLFLGSVAISVSFIALVFTYPIALLAIPGVIFVWWALGPPARRR